MKKMGPVFAVVVLLSVMVALMVGPIRDESATMDEPLFLATGYSYGHGYGFQFDPEQPPLAKMISAAPLWFMDVTMPPDGQRLLERRTGLSSTRAWSGEGRPLEELFPGGRNNWYFWPYWEGDVLGQMFVYGGVNDADKMLAAGRWMQVLLTVAAGVVIFLWVRSLSGPAPAVLGVALWAFNPLALAYGHLILTDMGVTLAILIAVWAFGRFLKEPTVGHAAVCGLACGGALLMKFTAVVLAPMFVVLGIVHWTTLGVSRGFWKSVPVIAITAAFVILLVYAPFWSPAPALSAEQAGAIGVPRWFQVLRPVLVPPGFFKGLALQTAHAAFGHEAFFCGQWRQTGWWYYFPVALALKMPVPLLLLTVAGLCLWLAGLGRFSFNHSAPWLAALVYLVLAMTGTINIGLRYLVPMFPLLAVGTASQLALRPRWVQRAAWLCGGWLLVVTWCAHPYYLEYFNEFAGGTANGYTKLIDSNLDWGQDVKRLKTFLRDRGIERVYLHYFGPPRAIDYYEIPCERVTAEQARTIRQGMLVVSATALMRPEWDWLRTQHQPVDRVGYTLFVYRMGDGKS